MNSPQAHPQSREFREVAQENEYDPMGKTVTTLQDGKEIVRYHIPEGVEDMSDELWEMLSTKARWATTDAHKARCWDFLMASVNEYWANARERLEGDGN